MGGIDFGSFWNCFSFYEELIMSPAMLKESCVYIELAAMLPEGKMVRNHFIRHDNQAAISCWRTQYNNRDIYATVCRFDQPGRSNRYLCPFFLDIDAEDLAIACEETVKSCSLLRDHLDITESSFEIYFSGQKGFHVLLPLTVFGDPDEPNLMTIWHQLAQRLAKENLPHLDLGIYQASRVLRLPNSIHSQTGLYKIPLEYKALKDWGIDYVRETAKVPASEESLAIDEESPKAVAWLNEAIEWNRRRTILAPEHRQSPTGFTSGWRIPPCIEALESAVIPDNMRHRTYFVLARFYAWIGMHPDEIIRRLGTIDARHPIKDGKDYIPRTAQGVLKKPGFIGCHEPILERYCRPEKCFRVDYLIERFLQQNGDVHGKLKGDPS